MLWIALAAAVGTVLVGLLTMRQPAVSGRQRRRGKSGDGGATMAGADDGATCDASASCDAGGGDGGGGD